MQPNILLLVIDSFRSDKFYGSKKTSHTPIIDSLVKQGIFFNQCISPSGTTSSSLACIFTSLYPFKTGMSGKKYKMISSDVPIYTTHLENNGYTAYAIIPQTAIITLGRSYGFNQQNTTTYPHHQRLFNGLGDKILKKLKSKDLKKPWFIYIHLMDLHFPVWPPRKFDDKKYGVSNYERTVSAIDYWLGKFLEHIDLEKTLLVITADHGDYIPNIEKNNKNINFEYNSFQKLLWKIGTKSPSLLYPLGIKFYFGLQKKRKETKFSRIDKLDLSPAEKRALLRSRSETHHRVYDDLIKVPLLFAGYNVPKKGVIGTQVGHIDIFPTIEAIAVFSERRSDVDGRSVLDIINDKNVKVRPIYIESPPSIKDTSEHVVGIRTPEYKYFRSSTNLKKNITLFDLKNDPLEEKNIATNHLNIVNEMEQLLQKMLNEIPKKREEQMDEDEQKKVEAELKKLGYL